MSRDKFLDELEIVSSARDPSESEPAEQNESASEPEADDLPAEMSPFRMRRRRRQLQNAVAGTLGIALIGALVMSRNFVSDSGDPEVVAIHPGVLFEQLVNEAKLSETSVLHVTDIVVEDAMISKIEVLDSIETLIFDKGAVGDESMKTIAELQGLQHLRLRLCPVGDEGLGHLSNLQSLWYLNLPHAECTAAGVGALAKLEKLRQLRLGSSKLRNEVTREIATITSLRGIHLIGVAVTDDGLKTLAAMPHLESLYLDDSAVTEVGWDWLFRTHPDLHVHVNQQHHDRDPKTHRHD
jgi:hypothetical protein